MKRQTSTAPIYSTRELPKSQTLILGVQHAFVMFGATVLVPILTGLSINVTLFTAGLGTLIFHLCTEMKVPAFLGSSFAFIAPISLIVAEYGGVPAAQGGIIIAGLFYLLLAILIHFAGTGIISSLFPPIVTGPIIMIIGLTLAPVAIDMAGEHYLIAILVILATSLTALYMRGFFRLVPIMMGLLVGYFFSLLFGIVDFAPLGAASWVGLPDFTFPVFKSRAILLIAPVAIVSMVEHIGDVLAIGETVERDFVNRPGIHRTLLGDGLATTLSGLFGGPPNTTYSENTGALALTKVYDPLVMRIAALFAIIISFIPKLGGLIQTIPTPVIGGLSIILFGMIASIGIRTIVENEVDLKLKRNLIIASVILILGIGGAVVEVFEGVEFSGMGLAAIVGLLLNKILPEDR